MNRLPRTVDVAALLDQRKLSSFNFKLIILSWLITVFDGLDIMMVSFTAPYMRDEMGLSKAMLGYVFSAGTLGMVLGGLIFPNIGDRIGRRPTIVFCAFAFGILTIATAFAPNLEMLLILRFLDGLAIGGMLPLAWALNIEFVPNRMRGTVVAVIMMGYSIGSAGAAPLTNLIAPTHGWQGVYVLGGVCTLFCSAALLLFLPESVRFLVARGLKPELVVRTLKRVDPSFDIDVRDRFILGDEKRAASGFRMSQLFEGDLAAITPLLWIAYFFSSLAIYFGSSWGPMVLEELKIPRSTAAIVASIGGLSGAAAGMILMRITDKHGPRSVAVFPAIAVPVLILLGLGYVPQALFLPVIVLQAILIGGEHSAVISISGAFYPSSIRASGGGMVASIGKIGGVFGGFVGGYILSSGPILRSYAFLAVCPMILFACILGIAVIVRGRVVHEQPPLDVVPAS